MPASLTTRWPRRLACGAAVALTVLLALTATGCGEVANAETTVSTASSTTAATVETSQTTPATAASTTETSALGGNESETLFDSSHVHEISVTFSEQDYEAMVQTYTESGDKDWIEATVTIDGATYQRVGVRLKGNSSIMGLREQGGSGRGPGGAVSADSPQSLPWLIRLDKYVDGQNYEGTTDLVVRSNTTSTSLNEAVALELLDIAGLASVESVACRFSVNGSAEVIRLATQLPSDEWMEEAFGSTGALYKAESTGDYSYRGDDPESYEEVFDQEAGDDNADLAPLIEFLDFINNSEDETFAAELPERLDIDAFATYLAMEELLGNFDDIDGPGNNSYLYYDPDSRMFTIVPWDHNLAFGVMNRGGGATAIETRPNGQAGVGGAAAGDSPAAGDGAAAGDGMPPGGGAAGDGALPRQDAGVRQPGQGMDAHGKENILVTRFHANTEFEALYDQKLTELKSLLYLSGEAQLVLDRWVQVLKTEASGLLDDATIDTEATKISTYFARS